MYSVVLGDPATPDRVPEVVRPDHVGVWFFDPRQRPSLNYHFRRLYMTATKARCRPRRAARRR
jgi:hypothetical protein